MLLAAALCLRLLFVVVRYCQPRGARFAVLGIPGRVGTCRGRQGFCLGSSRAVLGASWGCLGGLLGASLALLGGQVELKLPS